jgi:hypothetical protein
MTEIYYVYEHLRLDTNEIFYVGKGKCNRYKSNKNRNKHWHHIVNKCGFSTKILVQNIDEELAFLIEKELISKYKKMDINLVNYTDGGEGFSGGKHSDKAKAKMSVKATGRVPHNKGKSFSDEVKLKMSLAKKGKTPSNKGIPHTKDTKRKMSAAKVGVFKNKKWWTNNIVNVRSEICPGAEWHNGQVRK